jgi:hypothetical protein
MEAMNKEIKESCKSTEELKAYIDKNIEQVKGTVLRMSFSHCLRDFIGEVSKKLPIPFQFTAEGL